MRISWTNNKFVHRKPRLAGSCLLPSREFNCFSTSATTSDGKGGLVIRMNVKLKPSQNANKFLHTEMLPKDSIHIKYRHMTCCLIYLERISPRFIWSSDLRWVGPSLCRCRPSCADSVGRQHKCFSEAHCSVCTALISWNVYMWEGSKLINIVYHKGFGEITDNVSAGCIASASAFFCLCGRSNDGSRQPKDNP